MIKGIIVNDSGFCFECPYDKNDDIFPNVDACRVCRLKEKNSVTILDQFPTTKVFDATYFIGINKNGFGCFVNPLDFRALTFVSDK